MTEEHTSFEPGFEFDSLLRIISKQIYETPLALRCPSNFAFQRAALMLPWIADRHAR